MVLLSCMSNLVEIKKRIKSISSTIKVTKVMKMIATAKIAKIKPMMGVVKRYNDDADKVLAMFMKNTESKSAMKHYFETNGNNNVLLLLFSSDKGTCGSVNTNVFKYFVNEVKQYQKDGKKVLVMPIGKKAVKYIQTNLKKLGVELFSNEEIDAEYCNGGLISNIVNQILSAYDNNKFEEISVVSHKFKNIITCFVEKQQLLPASQVSADEASFINVAEDTSTVSSIMEYYIRTKIYNAYVSNIASIVSSRMNAMDNATKNGQEIINDLKIQYNKGRQAHITSELSDIVSGFEAIS